MISYFAAVAVLLGVCVLSVEEQRECLLFNIFVGETIHSISVYSVIERNEDHLITFFDKFISRF